MEFFFYGGTVWLLPRKTQWLTFMFVEAGSHNDKSTHTNEIYMGMKTSKFKALRPVWPGVLGIDCYIWVFLIHVCIILS